MSDPRLPGYRSTDLTLPWGLRELGDTAVRVTNVSDRWVFLQGPDGGEQTLYPEEPVALPLGRDETATLEIEMRDRDEVNDPFFFGRYVRLEFGGREDDGTYRWWKQ